MFEQQSKAREYLHLILNIVISSLFAVLEQLLCIIELKQFYYNIQGTLIWDLVFIPCGIIFSLIHITSYFHWNKGDLSSFFFWALFMKRIFLFGINQGEFVFFLFGLLNGIYTNKLNVNDKKKYYWKSKTIVQVLVIFVLTIINLMKELSENNNAYIAIFIILTIILGVNDNIEIQNQATKKQEEFQTDLKHNQFEIKKCQTTIFQMQQQQQQQKSNWEQYQYS